MPRPSTATSKATAELRKWKKFHNGCIAGYIYNDASKMYPDGTYRYFDTLEFRVIDHDWQPFILLKTFAWVFQLDRDEEDAD